MADTMRMFGCLGKVAARGAFDAVTGRLLCEYVGRSKIPLVRHTLEAGISCLMAPDLIVQSAGPEGRILATRGNHLYELPPGGDHFRRLFRLPCPVGKAWLLQYRFVRETMHRSDIVSVFETEAGSILAFSGGYVYRRARGEERFEEVFKLRHWGLGVGCGVMYMCIVQLPSGTILFGEYFRNPDYTPVHVYSSGDDGKSWRLAHAFAAGEVRHLHSMQHDPVTGHLWICSGDRNDHSFIGYSDDEGKTFRKIG